MVGITIEKIFQLIFIKTRLYSCETVPLKHLKVHAPIYNSMTKFLKRECLMRFKVGIAIHQSKALFKAYPRLAENFKFIKGLVHNLHKTGKHTLVL